MLENDDSRTQFYTGLPNGKVFNVLFNTLKPHVRRKISSYPLIDEFFLTSVKL